MEILWGYLAISLIYLGTRHFHGISAAATLDININNDNAKHNILKRTLGINKQQQFPSSDTNSIGNSLADGSSSSSGDTWNIVLSQDGKGVNTRLKRDATALSSGSSIIDSQANEGRVESTSRTAVKTTVDGSKQKLNGGVLSRRKRDTNRALERPQKFWQEDLPLLIENDTSLAVLQYIEQFSTKTRGTQGQKSCQLARGVGGGNSHVHNIGSLLNNSISYSYYSSIFAPHIAAAVRTSNLLSNIFKTWEITNGTLYAKDFYYSLARSVVESNRTVAGSTIAFDWKNFRSANNVGYFCPHVYRQQPKAHSSNDKHQLAFINLGERNPGFELCSNQSWFKEMRYEDNRFLSDYNYHKNICKRYKERTDISDDVETPVVTSKEGRWFAPHFTCQDGSPGQWVVSYSIPFYGCTINDTYLFKGVVNTKFNLGRVDIDQCSTDKSRPFADTHRCRRESTQCEHVPGFGFRRGGYKCVCKSGYYFNTTASTNSGDYFNGSVIEREYLRYVLNQSKLYVEGFQCLPCEKTCTNCTDGTPCYVKYDILMRGVPLGVTSFCMTIVLVIAYSLVRLRKSKVMKASFWLLLEIFIVGALLLYSTIIIQYFEPTEFTCLLIPWFREVGFAIVYGALVLKIYRVLAEFQSRKAHRVHVRDKDLLKWLLCIVCVVIGYMSAWTALNLDHVKDGSSMLDTGTTPEELNYTMCKSSWWDILIEIGEFIFLCFGIYLCYCIRAAPSDYLETRYISWAIYNETFISAILHIARHILWSITNPDYLFLMYFIRCQLTVTVNVALVLGPKIYYSHHPPEDESYRNRAYSTSDVQDNAAPESVKLHVGINSNGDVDVGEVNLSDMDPEDIRSELKRLYTQLQIYKTKTMRKDNPHISKRRGGRKHTHRRFSLQAFHHKHRHHHSHHASAPSASEVSMDHDTELSRTPEESTNSNEGCGYSMEESTCSVQEVRTPTVTFKPGHKTIY